MAARERLPPSLSAGMSPVREPNSTPPAGAIGAVKIGEPHSEQPAHRRRAGSQPHGGGRLRRGNRSLQRRIRQDRPGEDRWQPGQRLHRRWPDRQCHAIGGSATDLDISSNTGAIGPVKIGGSLTGNSIAITSLGGSITSIAIGGKSYGHDSKQNPDWLDQSRRRRQRQQGPRGLWFHECPLYKVGAPGPPECRR